MSTSYHRQHDRSLRGFFSAHVEFMNGKPLAFEMSDFSKVHRYVSFSLNVRIHAIKMRWAFLGPTHCLLLSYLYPYTYGVISFFFFFFNASGLHYSRHFIRGKDSCIVQSTYICPFSLGFFLGFFPLDLLGIVCFQRKKIKRTVPFPSGGKV